jgi:flagellar basal-body rod modification protein FlgD
MKERAMAEPVSTVQLKDVTLVEKSKAGRKVVPKKGTTDTVSRQKADKLSKESFLNLLVTQLRHQDPLEPMKDQAFIAQMAQFSALEQMQEMNAELRTQGQAARLREALDLLGHTVRAVDPKRGDVVLGPVREICFVDGRVRLLVDGRLIAREDVVGVMSAEETEEPEEKAAVGTHAAASTNRPVQAGRTDKSAVTSVTRTNRRNEQP